MAGLTIQQLNAIQTAERVASSLSVLGCLLVIFTWIKWQMFRKPIHRLIFYAAWGNLLTNVATIISRAGVDAGQNSVLCQSQAFIIQMFMPADALWTFAMALNVYLTFFKGYTVEKLHALEWKYFVCCYGAPLLPALAFVCTSDPVKGRIFGSAVLWCWITVEWNYLRIAMFYGPVWVVLLSTAILYAIVGRLVFTHRQKVQTIKKVTPTKSSTTLADSPVEGAPPNRSTTVRVMTTTIFPPPSRIRRFFSRRAQEEYQIYETVVERKMKPKQKRDLAFSNKTTVAYLKISVLFSLALLITWVPATVNRISTLVDPNLASFGLNFTESLLLPLQGFWNAAIYFSTSIPTMTIIYRRYFPKKNAGVQLQNLTARSHAPSCNCTCGVHVQRPQEVKTFTRSDSERSSSEKEVQKHGKKPFTNANT